MTMSYPVRTIDMEAYKIAFTQHIVRVLQNSIRHFIRKAVSKVPVDRGMARGTFLNLARVLSETVPISPKPHKGTKFYKQSGKPTVPRVPESGTIFSTVFNSINDVVKVNGSLIEFEFTNDLLYYYLNEFGLVHGPWDSYEEGKQELLAYFNANIAVDVPRLDDFITVTEVTIG